MQKLSGIGNGHAVAILLVALLSRAAHAGDAPTRCPIPEGADPSLAAVDAAERLDYLHQTLDAQAHYATLWKWSWFGIGSATLTSSIVFAAVSDNDADRIDGIIVSGFSVVTPIAALLFSLRAERDAPVVDKLFAETANGRAGECEVLARTEELFAKSADDEAFNTSWLAHAAAILGNGAMFSIMAVEAATTSDPSAREAHWRNAFINTGAGLVLTELQILTTPRGAVHGWRDYLAGHAKRAGASTKPSFAVAPFALAPGLSLSMRF
jgi:hypothetical protein